MAVARERGVDTAMLAEILPRLEGAVVNPPEPGATEEEETD